MSSLLDPPRIRLWGLTSGQQLIGTSSAGRRDRNQPRHMKVDLTLYAVVDETVPAAHPRTLGGHWVGGRVVGKFVLVHECGCLTARCPVHAPR